MSVKQYLLDDGTTITAQELTDALGISFAAAYRRLKESRDRKKVFEKPKCLRGERTYTRDGITLTATDVCREVDGLAFQSAGARALKWERGELSMEQMLLPKGQYRGGKDGCNSGGRGRGSAEWKGLSSKHRDAALKNIPGATRWELKQLRGM